MRLCPISIKPSVDVVKRVKGSGLKELYIIASDGLWYVSSVQVVIF